MIEQQNEDEIIRLRKPPEGVDEICYKQLQILLIQDFVEYCGKVPPDGFMNSAMDFIDSKLFDYSKVGYEKEEEKHSENMIDNFPDEVEY